MGGAGSVAHKRPLVKDDNSNNSSYKWKQDVTLKGPLAFLVKEKVQCACEGSRWCTRENPARQKGPRAFDGLHASWVGQHALAMARPWQSNVQQYDLPKRFADANIGMILNLQEVGEHAGCGPGNLPHTGFTYDHEPFMAAGVGVYNFGWRDMDVPSLDRMMDIVQVMDHVIRTEGRKVAVHCHAGLGRTGLAIACWMVFSGLHAPPDAIAEVRKHRYGAVQTPRQAAFVTIFYQYACYLRCLFSPQLLPAASPGPQGPGTGAAQQLAFDAVQKRMSVEQSLPPGAPPIDAGAGAVSGGDVVIHVEELGGARKEVYRSGLVTVSPLSTSLQAPVEAEGSSLVPSGHPPTPPWTPALTILPHLSPAYTPSPPTSYSEALTRQARVTHGPSRRAFRDMHRLVKDGIFYIVHEAHATQATLNSQASTKEQVALMSPPHSSHPGAVKAVPGQPSPLQGPRRASLGSAGPWSVARVLATLISAHTARFVDESAMGGIAAHPLLGAVWIGQSVHASSVLASVVQLKARLNAGDFSPLARRAVSRGDSAREHHLQGSASRRGSSSETGPTLRPKPLQDHKHDANVGSGRLRGDAGHQPVHAGEADHRQPSVLAVMMALEAFFANFTQPCFTRDCLMSIAHACRMLFSRPDAVSAPSTPARRPSHPPTTSPSTSPVAPAARSPNSPPNPAAAPVRVSETAEFALSVLDPMSAADQELLLVGTALIRLVASAAGPGCEDDLVSVARWYTRLLLGGAGPTPGVQQAEDAVTSFLWWLSGQDVPYAVLLLLKNHRDARRRQKPSVDVAVSAATAAGTHAPAPTSAAGAPVILHAPEKMASFSMRPRVGPSDVDSQGGCSPRTWHAMQHQQQQLQANAGVLKVRSTSDGAAGVLRSVTHLQEETEAMRRYNVNARGSMSMGTRKRSIGGLNGGLHGSMHENGGGLSTRPSVGGAPDEGPCSGSATPREAPSQLPGSTGEVPLPDAESPLTRPPSVHTHLHGSSKAALCGGSSPPGMYFHFPTSGTMSPLLALGTGGALPAAYREALAGISTVVYPPPFQSGHVEVHDVWR